jgi:YegS/Rv2252/BmrU family lipid kinase
VSAGPGRTFVVFNPASGRGRGRERQATYLRLLAEHVPDFDHAVSEAPGHEYALADRALDEGYGTIVAAGGDGTWSHVADRIVTSGRAGVRFAVLPSGTGNDFGRNLGLGYRDPAAAVRVLAAGRTARVDVGHVLTPSRPAEPGKQATGASRTRHFLNLVGFGFDIAVIDAAAGARFLRGEVLYKFTALQQLVRFPGAELALAGDAGLQRDGRQLMLTISNGRFFGGGFPIAPLADVRDGLLHACLIGDAPPLTRMRLFGLAGKGRHVESERVEVHAGPRFTVAGPSPLRFEVDGDVFVSEGPSVEVVVLPAALEVVVP